jgi:hypothetical protein
MEEEPPELTAIMPKIEKHPDTKDHPNPATIRRLKSLSTFIKGEMNS